jgi:arylsulfatase
MGEWKLYFPHKYRTIAPDQNFRDDGIPIKYTMVDLAEMELYHIPTDPSEKNNVIGENPQVVDMFVKLADKAREDLGDALTGNDGKNLRQPGRIN